MRNNIFTLSLSLFVILILSGCVGSMPGLGKKEDKPLPAWYVNPPANTPLYLYGEGMGDSLDDAKTNALNNMASRLVVQVSSSMKSKTKTSSNGTNSSYSKSLSKQVDIDVRKIEFSNAKVTESITQDNKFFVVMRVDRGELFNNKKADFLGLESRLDTKYKNASQLPKLEFIGALEDMEADLQKGISQSIVLNAINNKFNNQPYMDKFNSYLDKIGLLKEELTIFVRADSQSKPFADELISQLNSGKFKVSNNPKSDVVIDISNKVNYSMASGWQIAKSTTTVAVKSNNKTISNQIIKVNGRSSSTKDNAVADAAKNFGKKLKSLGLDTIIYSKK